MAPRGQRDPYEQLLALAERELECAGSGDYEALAGIAAEREAIVETLPATPPASARETIELALLTQERVTIELQRGRAQMLCELRHVVHARRAARGYGRSVGLAGVTRIDASA
jgi:hypothetical protein